MKNKLLVSFLSLLGMAVAVLPANMGAQARMQEQSSPSPGTLAVPAGSGFTYQGQLKSGGNPANGQYDFIFTLFDALTGGNQVGTAVNLANQTVSQGLFTVQLDFGANAFSGSARWLEIAVRQTGGGGYTTLSPRQALTAAPYSESLMPGAVVSGAQSGPTLAITNTNGIGVQGASTSGYGVRGYTGGANVAGVFGESSGNGYGVYGRSTSSYAAVLGIGTAADGTGIAGIANSGSTSKGVYGSGGNGSGVFGEATGGIGVNGYSGTGDGVYGRSDIGNGVHGSGDYGVYGEGSTSGVWGNSSSGNGVYGSSSATNGTGVHGLATGTGGNGVYGSGTTGVYGAGSTNGVQGSSSSGDGVRGYTYADGSFAGVYGADYGSDGAGVDGSSSSGNGVDGSSSSGNGVHGYTYAGYGFAGVYGADYGSDGAGVYGYANGGPNAVGVRGKSSQGYAGYFDGTVHVEGDITASGCKCFKIDDPLDPANKYLYHAAVESPDMMNMYNGNVTTDANGESVVVLPDYFEALNKDFRYQLTIMGDQFAQARVASKIKDNHFTIKTDKPNIEVSWQVTGIRQDPYANDHRIPVEQDKGGEDKGKYLYPEGFGQSAGKQINPWPQPSPSEGTTKQP